MYCLFRLDKIARKFARKVAEFSTATFGILSDIILEITEDYGNFRIDKKIEYNNRSIERNVCWVSTDQGKLNIAIKVLKEMSVEIPETKEFIDEKIEQKCSKENISIEVIFFSMTRQDFFAKITFQ